LRTALGTLQKSPGLKRELQTLLNGSLRGAQANLDQLRQLEPYDQA
jgi:hypothetical protein